MDIFYHYLSYFGFFVILSTFAYQCTGCIVDCWPNGKTSNINLRNDSCYINLPDNTQAQTRNNKGNIALQESEVTYPCQVFINATCPGCGIQLELLKFDLEPCSGNFTLNTGECLGINECEYVMMTTYDISADTSKPTTLQLHGNMTSQKISTLNSHVTLSFCYKMETFTSRNLHVTFQATVAELPKKPYYGPVAAWAFLAVAILGILAMVVVCFIPWGEPEDQKFSP